MKFSDEKNELSTIETFKYKIKLKELYLRRGKKEVKKWEKLSLKMLLNENLDIYTT